jgi:hypothetical protein
MISNRENLFCPFRLTENWKQVFSTQFFDDYSIDECTLLIEIMRLFQYRNDTLMRTQVKFNDENLLKELDTFKEECHTKEIDLVSIF